MKKRIVSVLLILAMLLCLMPASVFASERDESKEQVHVIVENTTFTPDNAEELEAVWKDSFWYGTLVDTWVGLDEASTMMSCVGDALTEGGYTAEGLDSGYITEINGLSAYDGGWMSGWMGTLNDWFTDQGFDAYTVAAGTLESGDEIRIMYTTNWGADLGSDWSGTDTSLKALTFSAGNLAPAFASDTLAYTLTVPAGTEGVIVTPTALNKNYQTHILVGETEYKRTETVPVVDGTVITISVGSGDSATAYTVAVSVAVDTSAAEAVMDLIDAIGQVTEDSGAAIAAARAAYDALPSEQKAFVANYDTLVAAEKAFAYLQVNRSLSADWPSFRGNAQNNGVTAALTPRTAEETQLKWAVNHSTGWSDAPSPVILVDDALVSMYGSTIKKLDLATGTVLASADMAGATSWGTVPATYADGLILCPLGNGTVQAFNAETLESVWVYTDPLGGQAQSPITCAGGKIYVGFGYNREYAFVCLNAQDGSVAWRETDAKSYYWAGAVVVGDYVIYGGESSHLVSRNKDTGALVSDLTVGASPIRSTVCYQDGKVYFTMSNASLCRADLDTQTGVLSNLTVKDCSEYGAGSTSTPVVYNGIVYIGVGGWSGSKNVLAVDGDTMEILWNMEEPAYPQCSILLSTAYVDSGYIYLYVTYNATPGGINVIKAKADGSEATQETLFDASGYEQYCTCSVIAGSDGTLYYKNDSGSIFALSMTEEAKAELAVENVIKLIDAIGEVTLDSEEAIHAARDAYDALTEAQKAQVTNYDVLAAAEEALALLKLPHTNAEDIYKTTGDYLTAQAAENVPTAGSIGGDWLVLGLARSGRNVPDGYYENVLAYVIANINDLEQLHRSKSTDNARVILALTAIGKDVTDVDGHNLLQGLTDMNYLKKQGINGPIWALIAFDCGNYEIPAAPESADPVTREKLIACILSAQLADGGWALTGETADADITAMALQALAPYYDANEAVRAAADKALDILSSLQQSDGGYGSMGISNAESSAQVIIALTALNIDPNTDSRFVKNGRSVVDALCGYYVEGGGFRHLSDGALDGMATEQGYNALTAYFRLLNGKAWIYDMSDVQKPAEPVPPVEPEAPTEPADPADPAIPETGDHFQLVLPLIGLCVGLFGLIALIPSKKHI